MRFQLMIDIRPSSGSHHTRRMEMKEWFFAHDADSAINIAGDFIQSANLEHNYLGGYDLEAKLYLLYSNEMIDKYVWHLSIVKGEASNNKVKS